MKNIKRRTACLFATLAAAGLIAAGAFAAPGQRRAMIPIDREALAPGETVSLGARQLPAGAVCSLDLNWEGGPSLWAVLGCRDGDQLEYPVLRNDDGSGSFQIKEAGSYTVELKNCSVAEVKNLKGQIGFSQAEPVKNAAAKDGSVVIEGVQIYRPSRNEGGFPYLHEVVYNGTGKKITAYERGMLAFDRDGRPLEVCWNSLDSDAEPGYDFLCDWGSCSIAPGGTENEMGGWTLDIYGKDPEVSKIEYALYCYQSLTFEDGSVWENPQYQSWLNTWRGKPASVSALRQYYPHAEQIGA